MKIKFLELSRVNHEYMSRYTESAEAFIRSGIYIGGDEVNKFEREFADYCGAKFCVGVGNGLDALVLSLLTVGIGPGDEVIVPAQTFIATWLAVSRVGASIVPIDVEPDTGNIDVSLLKKAITQNTKAIIPVHLYGSLSNMYEIMELAALKNIIVVEDAAQAHGAWHDGKCAGTFGHIGCYSFYPSKNLGALGDAGAIVTDNEVFAEQLRMHANYGSQVKYCHEYRGVNSRLDPIQAIFLRTKLSNLDNITHKRKKIAEKYSRVIDKYKGSRLKRLLRPEADSVWHNYVILASDRDDFIGFMSDKGVETAIHYPTIPPLQPCYKEDFQAYHFATAEKLSSSSVSLPIGEYLNVEEVEYICNVIEDYVSK